jgi:hypothetical protein
MVGLYTLKINGNDLSTGILEKAKTDSIDFEKDLENWLENSPNVLLDEDEGSIIWIGRQVSASVGESSLYPDLIGIDTSGDLVLVELKKGKTPREVISQILEYAVWGSSLDYDDLNNLAQGYYRKNDCDFNKNIHDLYKEAFFPDVEEEPEIEFNRNQKLFIVAEEISPVIQEVALYLRDKYMVDLSCLKYEVLRSKQGEYFISTEKVVGFTEVGKKHKTGKSTVSRWTGPGKVKDVIRDAVMKIVDGDKNATFSPVDVYNELIKEYPDVNSNTVRCQVIQDCVNHSSRKHYPSGQQDYYYRIDKGLFRLYDPAKDGQWNYKGEKVNS